MLKKLTKREQDVMDILWNSEEPLAATDIQAKFGDLSIFTIQQVLQRLLKKDMIKVDHFGKSKKALVRMFIPTLSQGEFYLENMSKANSANLISGIVEKSEDYDTLIELEKKIQNRIIELEKRNADVSNNS